MDAWWSATGAALFGACGALTLNHWRDVPDCPRKENARASAVCALAAATIFLIDTLLALCSVHKDEESVRSKSTKRCNM